MSTMSCIRRKMTAHQEHRVNNANKKRAIRFEQSKPDYKKLAKEEKRGIIASVLNRFRFIPRRAS
jgi:hypothetical protein